jgi:nucleoside-diphosphate-sugar epimerase/predicted dehydrogenase
MNLVLDAACNPTPESTPRARSEHAPRLIVLGGGAVVRECYLPALLRLGWLRNVLVVESTNESVQQLRSGFPELQVVQSDYRALLENSPLTKGYDGVIVALPNRLHEDAVITALQQRLAVLCEKPLGLDSMSCQRMAVAGMTARRPVMVGMVRRLIPAVRAIRQALIDGLIGQPLSVDVAHGGRFSWPSDSGQYFLKDNGGCLVNMGVHYLDMIEDWLGPLMPRRYRDDYRGGAEANFDFELSGPGDVSVRVVLSYTHSLRNSIIVCGTRGSITAGVEMTDPCVWQSATGLSADIRPLELFQSGNWPLDFASPFADQLVNFGRAIQTGEQPAVGPHQAASTLDLIDWAVRNREPLHPGALAEMSLRRPGLPPGPSVVTGGTGFVGTRLVARLHELGFSNIRIPVRSHRAGAGVACFPVERTLTDLLSYEQVKKAIGGSRYVFHLAYGADGKNASEVTVQGTRNVVEAAIESGVECVVVVSTTTVFGHTRTAGVVDETSPYRPDLGEYGKSKTEAEKYCLERALSSSRTRIVVLNPVSIYGPGGSLFTEYPIRAARAGAFCWIEDGRGRLNYTFVDNVVDALVLAAQCAAAHGQRFIIGDGICSVREFLLPLLGEWAANLNSYTRRELVERHRANQATFRELFGALGSDEMIRVLNRMPAFQKVKRFASRHFGSPYQKLHSRRRSGIGSREQAGTKEQAPPLWLADIFGPMAIECSSAKARTVLGWAPIVDLEEGQRRTVAWLRHLGLVESGDAAA